jgi:hypothetical protein
MASAVFEETFNVALGLINITVMDPNCDTKIDQKRPWNRACDATYALGDRLSDFSLWRSSMSNDGAGLWHLMTNCPYVIFFFKKKSKIIYQIIIARVLR